MRARLRVLAASAALLAPTLLSSTWTRLSPPTPNLAPEALLPQSVGPWRSVEERAIAPESLALVTPDAYRLTRFEAPGRAPIWAYVAYYAGRTGHAGGAHDPEVCYPAQGWEVLRSRGVGVPVGESDTLRGTALEVQKGRLREAVLYWFQPADRWPAAAAAEELLRVLDALQGRPHYAFVRISARNGSDLDADTARDVREFAGLLAGPIRQQLGSGHRVALEAG